jgi:hypothetical protein
MDFLLSVIIDNFNIRWAGLIVGPLKANAPLLVDPDGTLPLAVSLQSFEAIGVERGEIARRLGGVENTQTLLGLPPERLPPADFSPAAKRSVSLSR